jgi:hypothetical protein
VVSAWFPSGVAGVDFSSVVSVCFANSCKTMGTVKGWAFSLWDVLTSALRAIGFAGCFNSQYKDVETRQAVPSQRNGLGSILSMAEVIRWLRIAEL